MKGFLFVLLGAFLALVAVAVLGGGEGRPEPAGDTRAPARAAADGGAPTLEEGQCFPILDSDDEGRANAKQDVEVWDADGDCELGPDEYQDRLAFAAADRDNSGTVSLNEHHFMTILEFIDTNGDDLVSVGELAAVFPEGAQMFISLADADFDGRLSFAEFDAFAGDGKEKVEGDEFLESALRLEAAAFAADQDGDGNLSSAETPDWGRISHLDKDGDGLLTRREYRSRWLEVIAAESLAKFREADSDGDGLVGVADWSDDTEGFHMVDSNHDGQATEAEVLGFMERYIATIGELPEVEMFILLDADNSGDLSYAEMPPGEAQDGFVFLDLDLSGLVSWEEAQPILIMHARSEALGERRLATHFAAMDTDGDGILNLEELGLDEETFAALDQNGDNGVTRDELVAHEAAAVATMG